MKKEWVRKKEEEIDEEKERPQKSKSFGFQAKNQKPVLTELDHILVDTQAFANKQWRSPHTKEKPKKLWKPKVRAATNINNNKSKQPQETESSRDQFTQTTEEDILNEIKNLPKSQPCQSADEMMMSLFGLDPKNDIQREIKQHTNTVMPAADRGLWVMKELESKSRPRAPTPMDQEPTPEFSVDTNKHLTRPSPTRAVVSDSQPTPSRVSGTLQHPHPVVIMDKVPPNVIKPKSIHGQGVSAFSGKRGAKSQPGSEESKKSLQRIS